MSKRRSKHITKAYTWGFPDVMIFFETYRCLAKWAFFKTWYSKINKKTKYACIHESFNTHKYVRTYIHTHTHPRTHARIHTYIHTYIHIYIFYTYIYIYIYIYIWYSFWAKVFRFHIESWPEWDSNPRPRAYRVHALNHWAIWPNDQTCLMVYRIKWPRSSSHR